MFGLPPLLACPIVAALGVWGIYSALNAASGVGKSYHNLTSVIIRDAEASLQGGPGKISDDEFRARANSCLNDYKGSVWDFAVSAYSLYLPPESIVVTPFIDKPDYLKDHSVKCE